MTVDASLASTPALAVPVLLAALLGGCADKPIIRTEIVEKPIAVPCALQTPRECKSLYATDRLSAKDDALTVNRALRAEIEERWACEIRLRAAVRGCNKGIQTAPDTENGGL